MFEKDAFAGTAALRNAEDEFWFWKVLATRTGLDSQTIDFDLVGNSSSGQATLRLMLHGATETTLPLDHRVHLWLNDQFLETIEWDGPGMRVLRAEFDGSLLQSSGNQLRVETEAPQDVDLSILYIDRLEVDYQRFTRAPDGYLKLQATGSVVTVADLPSSSLQVIDVTDPQHPVRLSGFTVDQAGDQAGGNRVTFASTPGRRYVVVTNSAIGSSSVATRPATIDIARGAEYVIIAPEELLETVQSLADYRAAGGLTTMVVSLESIYDHYADGEETPWGRQQPAAPHVGILRDRPRFAVLVGKGNFDYKDNLGKQNSFLRPWWQPHTGCSQPTSCWVTPLAPTECLKSPWEESRWSTASSSTPISTRSEPGSYSRFVRRSTADGG